eukprot:836096_1
MASNSVWLMISIVVITIERVTSFATEEEAQSWLSNWSTLYNSYWSGEIDFDDVWEDILATGFRGRDDSVSFNKAKGRAFTNTIRRKSNTDAFTGITCEISGDNVYGPSANTLIVDCIADIILITPFTATVHINYNRVFTFNSDGLIIEMNTISESGTIGSIISEIAQNAVGDSDAFVVEFGEFKMDRLDILFASVFCGTTMFIIAILIYIVKKVNAIYRYFGRSDADGVFRYSKAMNNSCYDDQE